MNIPPADRPKHGVPHTRMTLVPEPWPIRRLRGLRIYLGKWLADVADDVKGMWHR